MPTLFLDIDNTLIYSHRHSLNAPKRVAEYLNGKEQSYITEKTYNYLSTRKDLTIVPVTTRTLPQFMRVEALLGELGCTNALICNGAILIHNGTVDAAWKDESLRLSEEERKVLPLAVRRLQSKCGKDKTHVADELFVYAGTDDPVGMARDLMEIVDAQKVDILRDSRKVYCIPKTLNKGTALQRFISRFDVSHSIAAGDSDFDVPMLNQADLAIVPQELQNVVQNEREIICDADGLFSDEICRIIAELRY